MTIKEKISDDLISALKSKEGEVVAVLRLLKNAIQMQEKNLRKELDDGELNKILLSESKKRKDSIEQFQKGGREDLVIAETRELDIITKYLPEMKSAEEIKNVICDIINTENIDKSMSNFGQVMKMAMQKLDGQAEGNLVSKIVKEQLS